MTSKFWIIFPASNVGWRVLTLTNIDTKSKCRHLKNLPVKSLFGRCLSKFIDWRCNQSRWYFRPSFVNCCPSSFSLVTPPPPPYVNDYTVYTYTEVEFKNEQLG
jgi:hypothetical protein